MAITIIPEDGTGLSTANSYLSVADADAYFEGHLYAAGWTAAAPGDKDKAIAMATRLIDAHTRWSTGEKKTSTQALQWPREGAELDGFEIAANLVPDPVKNATAELAMLLIANNLTADVEQNQLQGVSLGKGALEITFKDNRSKRQFPFHVTALLRGLGTIRGGGGFQVVNVSR